MSTPTPEDPTAPDDGRATAEAEQERKDALYSKRYFETQRRADTNRIVNQNYTPLFIFSPVAGAIFITLHFVHKFSPAMWVGETWGAVVVATGLITVIAERKQSRVKVLLGFVGIVLGFISLGLTLFGGHFPG